jgi:hypothetical protein
MKNSELSKCDLLADKMKVELYVLRPAMVDRIGHHIHRGDVVAVDDGGPGHHDVQLTEQLTEPATLGDGVGDGTIFRLCTGAGHRGLPLGGP